MGEQLNHFLSRAYFNSHVHNHFHLLDAANTIVMSNTPKKFFYLPVYASSRFLMYSHVQHKRNSSVKAMN